MAGSAQIDWGNDYEANLATEKAFQAANASYHSAPVKIAVKPNVGGPSQFFSRIAQSAAGAVKNVVEGAVNMVVVQPGKEIAGAIASLDPNLNGSKENNAAKNYLGKAMQAQKELSNTAVGPLKSGLVVSRSAADTQKLQNAVTTNLAMAKQLSSEGSQTQASVKAQIWDNANDVSKILYSAYTDSKTAIAQANYTSVQKAYNTKIAQITQAESSGKMSKVQAQQERTAIYGTLTKAAQNASSALKQSNSLKAENVAGEAAGAFLDIATLGIGALFEKGMEIGATDATTALINQVGPKGIQTIAEQLGIDTTDKATTQVASDIVKSNIGQDALKQLAKTATPKVLKVLKVATNTGESAGIMSGFSAANAAGQGGSVKQIKDAAISGGLTGAVLGFGGSVIPKVIGNKIDKYTGAPEKAASAADKIKLMNEDANAAKAQQADIAAKKVAAEGVKPATTTIASADKTNNEVKAPKTVSEKLGIKPASTEKTTTSLKPSYSSKDLKSAVDDVIYKNKPELFYGKDTNGEPALGEGGLHSIPRIHVDDLKEHLGNSTDIPAIYKRTTGPRNIDLLAERAGYDDPGKYLGDVQKTLESRNQDRENAKTLSSMRKDPNIIKEAQQSLEKKTEPAPQVTKTNVKNNLAMELMDVNPTDKVAVKSAYKRAGYTEVDGFMVHPDVDSRWVKDLSPNTKQLMHDKGITYIDHTSDANGMAVTNNLGDTTLHGVAVRSDKNMDVKLFSNKDAVVAHEIGHQEWKNLTPQEQAQWQTKASDSGSSYIDRLKSGEQKSAGSIGEEAFAEDFALQKTGNYAGGNNGKVAPQVSKTADLQKVAEETPKITSAAEKLKGRSNAAQAGSIDIGAISIDAAAAKAKLDAYREQTKVTSKFSGDVAHDARVQEQTATLRAQDAGKLLKEIKVNNVDKKAVYDYREAKAAGTELPKLTRDQQVLHEAVTAIVKETNDNKQQLVKMKAPGYSDNKIFDAESGNHRIVIGKGSGLERFLKGDAKSPTSARSLRISTNSMRARKFFSVTDEDGNREVATILNRSHKEGLKTVSDGKFATILNSDTTNPTELGKLTAGDMIKGYFKAKDGQTYKIGQATASEIAAVSYTRYIKDPLVSAIIDHQATANALDSARMLEKWKNSPEFSKIGMKFGAGTPPRDWVPTTLPQFQGYSFEPKVAEVLNDLHANIKDRSQLTLTVNHFFRNVMFTVPLRHNLNEIGFHFVDRGITGLFHPIRGSKAIISGINDVMTTSKFYRDVAETGFNLMTNTDKGLNKGIMDHTKSMLFDDQNAAEKIASDIGSNVTSLREAYNKIQHSTVWVQQDALNLSRIHERMDKGMTLEQAAAETARFNPQYQVPSRVAGSRAAANILKNNNLLFFGSYHYDQWKVISNSVMDLAGKNGGKAALAAADKFAAMTLGIYATGALVDKGLQAITGNTNANTKPFGVLDLPSQIYKTVTGQEDVGTLLSGQIFPAISLNTVAQLFENRDFYTGSQIRDTNASASDQIKQLSTWLYGQSPMSFIQNEVTKGNTAAGVGGAVLALAGAKFPKNSVETNNLYSLKYDSLPNIQQQAYKQAQAGDVAGAKTTISQYDTLVLAAAKAALKSANKPVPSDKVLTKDLLKQQYYYKPKDATIVKWSKEHSTSIVNKLK
jgi:hypothetical protein